MDENRSCFLIFIPVNEGCGNVVTLNENVDGLPGKLPKSSMKALNATIAGSPSITIRELSEQANLSERTIKNHLRY